MRQFNAPGGTRFMQDPIDAREVTIVRNGDRKANGVPLADLLAFADHVEAEQLASNPSLRKAVMGEGLSYAPDVHIIDPDKDKREFIRRAMLMFMTANWPSRYTYDESGAIEAAIRAWDALAKAGL